MIFGTNVLSVVPPSGPIRIWDAQCTWADLEKKRGTWDWTRLDAIVNSAGKRSIMLVLGHPPAWAAKGGPDGKQAAWMSAGSNRPPSNMNVWKMYISAVVNRYKGRIGCYQIWNEPADKRFYTGTYSELATLMKVAYTLIKQIDKNATVISPPLQPRRQAAWATRGQSILKCFASVGYPFDVYSMHIYPQKDEGIKGFRQQCTMVKAALFQKPQKPLWITETNFNLGGMGNPYPLDIQAAIRTQVKHACNDLNIARCYWYAYAYDNPSLIAINEFGV